MSELSINHIIYGILAVIIIVSFLFSGVYLFSNNARSFVDSLIGFIGGEEESIQETPESIQIEQKFFNQFFDDYQKCKKSPDLKCVCNMHPTYVPEGYYLELLNTNGVTSMSLTPGSINANGEPITTVRSGLQFKVIEGTDNVLVGNFKPTLGKLSADPYIDDNNNFIINERYIGVRNLFLQYEKWMSRQNLDVYSQTRLFSEQLTEYKEFQNSFNLKGIYKIDNNEMAFVPSPNIPANPDERSLANYNNVALAQQFRSLPKCRDTIEGYEEAKEAFDIIVAYIRSGIMARSKSPREDPMKMDSVNINLPENFKIKIYPQYIALFENNKKILRTELEIGTTVASGKRGTSSWQVKTNGVCYFEKNRFKQTSDGYELNKNTKQVLIYLTNLDELCFALSNTDSSLIA